LHNIKNPPAQNAKHKDSAAKAAEEKFIEGRKRRFEDLHRNYASNVEGLRNVPNCTVPVRDRNQTSNG
jgi:hypothetical protein